MKIHKQMISTLSYYDEYRIEHRDLKPENVSLDRMKTLKSWSFFKNRVEPGQMLNQNWGAYPFHTHDLFLGKHWDGSKNDIWTLGVGLYFMVEGNVPFHSVIIQELRGHVVPCVYTAHCGVAEGLDDLLSLLMRVNPRYSLRVTEVRYIFVSRNTTRETKIPVRKWSYSGHTLQLCSQCNTVCLEPKISYIDYINESIKRP